ncbi:MAG: SRPBCC domain-containing protein [Chloroflexota bacterium]
MTIKNRIADPGPELVLTRLLDAPRHLVFEAWTSADRAFHWWGPSGFTTFSIQLDPRAGGSWRRGMRTEDGTEYWASGEYREVSPHNRLVFTYRWDAPASQPREEMLVELTFEDAGSRTRMTLRQTGFSTGAVRDDHVTGWTGCLERLADFVAATASS